VSSREYLFFYSKKLSDVPSCEQQLCEVAAGLSYREYKLLLSIHLLHNFTVHSSGVIHGDLTGVRELKYFPFPYSFECYVKSNILIGENGKAYLADFGLSNVLAEVRGYSYVTSSIGGSVRWAAPEIFRVSQEGCVSTVTTYGDIYSYGSVMLQVR
jgi:serine/threonine protein kinase